mmetsp:Transcript_6097/g.17460  ORF Transcript_6097/g.17460 Transcript_6097/m.17460 type:complete len:308 (-) Transcript_6097:672-1595(-)|eukprot:CAMPEP_0206143634 /NCGR_PEP_ID=MMETSP1473-20131121/21244_1 /ASSEMBLY_ACC=CAM_ASM_001109 /TAXON_ID=1461547 /ORGANISM="Stichococcus sp, Strain RCC1054" /LENGTH=307 /DNA_ID=CAMNT_0053539125 /DNA_START=240 /DNA_END=1163 /DNA_ORIENTATION=-
MKILVVGGSGYLGQFVVGDLAKDHEVAFTHYSSATTSTLPHGVKAFWVDLKKGEGFADMFGEIGAVDVVINSAAMSSPAACENFVTIASQVNVPIHLLDALNKQKQENGSEPLLIHLSTDQVYDGSKAMWTEDDACEPINTYGRTKLAAEQAIRQRWPRHLILRSSIIYGPQCPVPVSRALFLQFIVAALKQGKPTSFFKDEFRSAIYVQDILKLIRAAIDQRDTLTQKLLNMGGPERLSRLDMAEAVAETYGLNKAAIQSATSASVERAVASPPDISMDSSRLKCLGVPLTPLRAALEQMRADLLQ